MCEEVEWILLAQDRDLWRLFFFFDLGGFRVPLKLGDFLR